MPRRIAAVVAAVLLLLCAAARSEPPRDHLAALARGVSLTGWFRFPASADPQALRAWMSDPAMLGLRHAGFTFVRLAVQPEFIAGDPDRQKLLVAAIRRLQTAGLAVVVDAHPVTWELENRAEDRQALLEFWHGLAPALRPLPPRLTFPELLNEPVFHGRAAEWAALQHAALAIVRGELPDDTVVLTGADWGSVNGLLQLEPERDSNTIYSFHFYDPVELTSLAAYRAGLRREDLARLPFPAGDQAACHRTADASADPATAGMMRFYCSLGWDAARVAARIEAAAAWGRRHRAAILLGEFGASARLNAPARLAWLRTVREACGAEGIGWALWGYDDEMGFAIRRPPGLHPVLDQGVLAALGLAPAVSLGNIVQ